MRRISNTWALAKESWAVLNHDRELLILPLLSFVATLLVMASFLVPLFASGALEESADAGMGPVQYVLLFGMYVTLAFVTIFFNAALVSAANERMGGGDPTLGSALRGASAHLGSIFSWAVVSATVSVILRSLEERAGIVGRLVAGFAGLAWSLVTFLVIPVMVIERIGMVDAVKRSASLFKQTWGEQVAASVGFGLLGFLAALPGIAVAGVGIATGSGAAAVVGITLGVLWVGLVAVVMSALNGIFQTALYRYASAGNQPVAGFDTKLLAGSFTPSSRR